MKKADIEPVTIQVIGEHQPSEEPDIEPDIRVHEIIDRLKGKKFPHMVFIARDYSVKDLLDDLENLS